MRLFAVDLSCATMPISLGSVLARAMIASSLCCHSHRARGCVVELSLAYHKTLALVPHAMAVRTFHADLLSQAGVVRAGPYRNRGVPRRISEPPQPTLFFRPAPEPE